MSDDVTIEPGAPVPNGDTSARLLDAVAELNESVKDAARRTAALDARIDSLPGPVDIAVAVEAEVERAIRDARDAIDSRVASLGVELASLQRRISEVGDALLPLEGLRTEIATVADQGASLKEARAGLAATADRLAEVVGRIPALPDAPEPADLRPQLDEKLREFEGTLEQLTATIRSDFELLVRAEQQATERQIDALGLRITNLSLSVTKALEDLASQSQRMSERAGTIEGENAAILSAVKNEVETVARTSADAVAERSRELDASLGGRVGELERKLTDVIATLDARVGALPAKIETTLGELRAAVASMPDAPGTEIALQSLVDAVASSLANMREDLDGILQRQRTTADASAQQLRASLDNAVAQMGAREASARGKLLARLEEIDAALGTVVVGVRDVLGSAASKTQGTLDQLRGTTSRIADSMTALQEAREQQSKDVQTLSEHLDARAARLKAAITERTGAIESAIAALPRGPEMGEAIAETIRGALEEARRATDVRMENLEREIGTVASNVNEIWMRVRSIVKAVDEQRKTNRDDVAAAAARMEELAAAENRLVVRLLQVEQRVVASMRGLETERDRIFIESLGQLAQGLGRRDRKRFRKRMAETPTRQETPIMAQPAAAPQAPPREDASPPAPAPRAAARKSKAKASAKTAGKPPRETSKRRSKPSPRSSSERTGSKPEIADPAPPAAD